MKAILHADKEWGIGKGNDLMFSLPLDMKFFRQTTKGGVVVMGKNTLLSFPEGKPLKYRTNVVLSRTLEREDVTVVKDLTELKKALETIKDEGGVSEDNVFVIGGGEVYKLLLPYCEKVLVTRVEAVGNADTFFPDLDVHPDFVKAKRGEDVLDNGTVIHFDEYWNINVQKL